MQFQDLPKNPTMLVALQAPIGSLKSLCKTNKKLAEICRQDHFWKLRTEQDYPEYVDKKPKDLSWRKWYQKIRYGSLRLVVVSDGKETEIARGIQKIIKDTTVMYDSFEFMDVDGVRGHFSLYDRNLNRFWNKKYQCKDFTLLGVTELRIGFDDKLHQNNNDIIDLNDHLEPNEYIVKIGSAPKDYFFFITSLGNLYIIDHNYLLVTFIDNNVRKASMYNSIVYLKGSDVYQTHIFMETAVIGQPGTIKIAKNLVAKNAKDAVISQELLLVDNNNTLYQQNPTNTFAIIDDVYSITVDNSIDTVTIIDKDGNMYMSGIYHYLIDYGRSTFAVDSDETDLVNETKDYLQIIPLGKNYFVAIEYVDPLPQIKENQNI